jgi:hypothetical protein
MRSMRSPDLESADVCLRANDTGATLLAGTLGGTQLAFRWTDLDQRPTEPCPDRGVAAVTTGCLFWA